MKKSLPWSMRLGLKKKKKDILMMLIFGIFWHTFRSKFKVQNVLFRPLVFKNIGEKIIK